GWGGAASGRRCGRRHSFPQCTRPSRRFVANPSEPPALRPTRVHDRGEAVPAPSAFGQHGDPSALLHGGDNFDATDLGGTENSPNDPFHTRQCSHAAHFTVPPSRFWRHADSASPARPSQPTFTRTHTWFGYIATHPAHTQAPVHDRSAGQNRGCWLP